LLLYLQRLACGGKVAGRSFGGDAGRARFDVSKLGPLLEEIHDRLAGVTIECLPWAEFVDRYGTKGRLFYLDPPYWGSEMDYGLGVFTRTDFSRLALRLARISRRFMLSVNDVPQTREIFGRFTIEQVMTQYIIAGGKPSGVAEIVVTGPSSKPLAATNDHLF